MLIIKRLLRTIENLTGKEHLDFRLLAKLRNLLSSDYRMKWPQLDWWKNKEFDRYLNDFDELHGFNTDRKWMLYQLIRLCEAVPGDTVECGSYLGGSSYLICASNSSNNKLNKHHHIFDSFEGLSCPSKRDGSFWSKGALAIDEEAVKNRLSPFSCFSLYKGWIPDRFSEVELLRFSFVHIDVDLYQPTKDSFEFFYPRMNPGGIILCDDYGFSTCPGATESIDSFLENHSEKMIALSGGGGFMIKGVPTSPSLSLFSNRTDKG